MKGVEDMFEKSKQCRFKLRSAYQDWIHEILTKAWNGKIWNGFQVTFMFHHIPGTFEKKCEIMEDEMDRVYRTLVLQVERYPRTPAGSRRLPILIAFPDSRQQPNCGSYSDATINDGLHFHGILLVHPDSRLKVRLDMHLKDQSDYYIRPGDRLRRIFIQPIDERTASRAVGYGFKSFEWRIPDTDRIFIRPRAVSELPDYKHTRERFTEWEGRTQDHAPLRGKSNGRLDGRGSHGVKIAPIPLTKMRAF